MNIGRASAESGISAKMIRYYESIGLVPAASRTNGGYREYSDNDVHTLRFIRRARDLGFTVEQMTELLALWRDRKRASADVKRIALKHVQELEHKACELREMSRTLKHLADHCKGNERPDCPIIDELAEDADAEAATEAARPSGRRRFGATGRAAGGSRRRAGAHAKG